jgi:uncharacterized membrane protein YphA (DoxX/SURF4 family)
MNQSIIYTLQIITAVGLLNVWLLRFNKKTAYRGGEAKSLVEEFAVYGLPAWFCYFIGFLKITSALLLIAGIFYSFLTFPAALLIAFLMVGAISMHIKVKDPLMKSAPALIMLMLSVLISLGSLPI